MATLNWIGKDAVVGHHREVPYHLLRAVPELSVGENHGIGSGNLLIQGDNLLALKALLPYYAGKVKCIYIDPPYNTGNEKWVYNDNVNSPEIRQWLGKVVGKEGETLDRHDRWLCMMYPRLVLLREMLRNDGVCLISIGKDEIGHLRLICDEVFGRACHVETFIWQIEGNVENQEAITSTHDYIVAYERKRGESRPRPTVDPNVGDDSKLLRDFAENSVIKNGDGNPASIIEFPGGFPASVDLIVLDRHACADDFVTEVQSGSGWIARGMKEKYGVEYPIRLDELVVEGGVLQAPCRMFSGWSSARKLDRYIQAGCTALTDDDGSTLRFFLSHKGVPTYRREARTPHFVPTTLRNMGTTETASNELERMGVRFQYPKPVPLLRYVIGLYAGAGDIVIDSFAGSGTAGHACLALDGSPNFVLVEMEPAVAKDATARRLAAVCRGYTARRGSKEVTTKGMGGGFQFVTLSGPLIDPTGNIRDGVSFAELASHLFFTETGVVMPTPVSDAGRASTSPFIGLCRGTAYYLLFNGILGETRPMEGHVLTSAILAKLPPHDGPKVIFGDACRVGSSRLKSLEIAFRQIPYQVQVS